MPQFENYLDDLVSYRKCEAFWQQLFQDVLSQLSEESDWIDDIGRDVVIGGVRYDPVAFSKAFDCLPVILWRVSPSLRRAVSIRQPNIQIRRSDLEIRAKIDRTNWLHYSKLDILEIFTHTSELDIATAKQLLRAWVVDLASAERMESLIGAAIANK